MEFTQQHLTNVENLARLNYTIRQIAVYIGFDVDEIYEEYQNKQSPFRISYDRGIMTTQIAIEKANLDLATGGNSNAIQRHDKKVIERQIREAKERIFGRS